MLSYAELAARSLDPDKPVIEIDGDESKLTLSKFFRSLCSDKVRKPKSVRLMWRTNGDETPLMLCAVVRILIVSMTQVYVVDPVDPESPDSELSYSDFSEWSFVGYLRDPNIDLADLQAEHVRVRGFINYENEAVGTVFLQVIDGPLELPHPSGILS